VWQLLHNYIAFVKSPRALSDISSLYLAELGRAPHMCAASLTVVYLLDSAFGPTVETRQSGFEQTKPALFARSVDSDFGETA